MPDDNLVRGEIDEATLEQVMQHLDAIEGLMPKLVKLNNKERNGRAKMGDLSGPFIGRALEHAEEHPEWCPNALNVDYFREDVNLFYRFRSILMRIGVLTTAIKHTQIQAGYQAWRRAIFMYNTMGMLTKRDMPGIKSAYAEMEKYYKAMRTKRKPESKQTEAENEANDVNTEDED